jgi:hypothetical protein
MNTNTRTDYAAALALFLTERKGSPLATWEGKMSAADQRALFGRYIGKGTIVIDGTSETICNRVKVCFGLDSDDRNTTRWAAL